MDTQHEWNPSFYTKNLRAFWIVSVCFRILWTRSAIGWHEIPQKIICIHLHHIFYMFYFSSELNDLLINQTQEVHWINPQILIPSIPLRSTTMSLEILESHHGPAVTNAQLPWIDPNVEGDWWYVELHSNPHGFILVSYGMLCFILVSFHPLGTLVMFHIGFKMLWGSCDWHRITSKETHMWW